MRIGVLGGAAAAVLALGGCGGGGSSEGASSSGPPPCSNFANGQEITQKLALQGCEDPGATVNASIVCGDQHRAIAVGPVYGFVGKPAKYLGKGQDASKSAQWQKFKTDCPYDSQ